MAIGGVLFIFAYGVLYTSAIGLDVNVCISRRLERLFFWLHHMLKSLVFFSPFLTQVFILSSSQYSLYHCFMC